MQVVYAGEPFPDRFDMSLFLVGPTLRDRDVLSWRPEAVGLLEAAGFDGVVFVPEDRGGARREEYEDQVGWEWEGLALADYICAWVPRSLPAMPAFTTNVEIGLWAHSGKVLLGAPPGAPKTSYLLYTAARLGIPVHTALDSLLRMAVGLCGAGAGRAGGERYIPVSIWVSPVFQSWYGSQRAAGHRLARARVVWQHPARAGQAPFLWALHPQIEVAGEGRAKTNEIVVGRPDISVVAALVPAAHLDDVRVLCVQEFRSPVRNPAGLVLELPSGSACRDDDPVSTALAELAKETGLVLPAGRLVPHGSRQLLPTLATYHAHLFSVVLEAAETARLERDQGVVRGVGADGERTQVMLVRLGDIVGGEQMDWAMLGMLQSVAGRAVRP